MPNTIRQTSEIEWSIFEAVIHTMLDDLQQAWTPMFPDTKFEIKSHESRPSMVQAVQPQDTVITFTLKVKVGSSEGYMHLSLPTAALKPFARDHARSGHFPGKREIVGLFSRAQC